MDESKPDQSLDKGAKTSNVETHGLRDDIDVNTPIGDVKGPNVFERAKEEFEAIVVMIHRRKGDKNQASPSSVQRDDATFTGSKHGNQSSSADKGVNGKEETEALLHTEKRSTHNKETHGLRDDIDVNTPLSDIKGPNVFERVKEEFEAIVESIHQRKEDKNQDSPSSVGRDDATFTGSKYEKQSSLAEDHKSGPSKIKQDKVESPKKKPSFIHHKETHGKGEDIDVDTPISEFKGPSIFHRAKEEIEAIVDTIQSKKESEPDTPSPKKEGGFRATIGKKLHTIYTKNKNRD
ncbi:hypothetical protein L6452_03989 [Arctium lappa]|uniref:Uncharacterized protein n=1 Tax=Arctium lappa TaxID=4217 RepID=A0ACB9FPR9_ARCLA|nr:hypothetical protein L6452_03989 [Arctium lappa]